MSETSEQKEEEDISQKNEDISQDISQKDEDVSQDISQVQNIDIPQKDDDEEDYCEKSNYDILNISQQIYTYQQKILYLLPWKEEIYAMTIL